MESAKARLAKRVYEVFPVAMTRWRFLRLNGRLLRLRRPVTYCDKVSWLKLHEYPSNKKAIRCADKYLLREYAAELGLADHLNPLYGVWDDPADIDFDALPDRFVLKANHGCGMNLICRDRSKFDRVAARRQLALWLACDYGRETAQYHYSGIPRKVICEALIEGEVPGLPPADYKVHCANGVPVFVNHTVRGEEGVVRHFYDPEWNLIPVVTWSQDHPSPRPAALDELLRIARTLSAGIPYVRVDLYAPRGEVIIGEMTFTPGRGSAPCYTGEGDHMLGELLDIEGLVKARRANARPQRWLRKARMTWCFRKNV